MEINFLSLSLSQKNMHHLWRYACTDMSSVVTEKNPKPKNPLDLNW